MKEVLDVGSRNFLGCQPDKHGSKNYFFDPHVSTDTMTAAGETVKVGVYELKQVVEATGSVTVVKIKPVRKRAA